MPARVVLGVLMILGVILYAYGPGSALRAGGESGVISANDAGRHLRHGSNIYFNVTFGSEAYLKKLGEWKNAQARLRSAQPFVISANTHVGNIGRLSLDGRVFLRENGTRYPATVRRLTGTTHHNTYLVYFPRYDMQGRPLFARESGSFEVVITGVDVPERVFTFDYPLPQSGAFTRLPQMLMLLGSALAALLVACTPCLTGSMTVGALTMGVSGGNGQQSLAGSRKRMVTSTLSFLTTLIGAYWLIALAAGVFGLQAEDMRVSEMIGGAILLLIGLGFLIRAAGGGDYGLTSGQSSAVGASLAMVCSVAGAPTLSAAVILPLLVYAGINDWYWAGLILLVYLVIVAAPFFLIATGMGEHLARISLRWRQRLLAANALVLIGLGLLLMVPLT